MSQSWQCPQCKAINPKPDYILRLAKLSQSLGTVSLGTTGNPAPRCSQCRFEANINAMLTGEYDRAGPEPFVGIQKIESIPATGTLPQKQDRTALFVVIGVCIVLLILSVLVVPGILDYLDSENGMGVSPPQVTPSPIAFPSVRILGQAEALKLKQTLRSMWTLEGRATGKPLDTGNVRKYTVRIVDGSEPLIWDVWWCAATEAILAQNLEHISYTFILNGISIPLDQFEKSDHYDDELQEYCSNRSTVLVDWTPGGYLLKTITKFEQAINDGWGEILAGTRTTEYHITVTAESP